MHDTLTEVLGYAAAGLVLATFSVRSIAALRTLAIASNLLFIAYAACADLSPVLVLHALLLPLNALRLHEALSVQRNP
jgi:CRP/FNR family transcriptional regulator, cyclic AMP receptor protein